MVELGQLEAQHAEFEKRKARVFVISNDDLATAKATQADFPHLLVVSDAKQEMAKAVAVLHPGAGPIGDDTNAPTTMVVDGMGNVRWFARPERILVRLTPAEILATIDQLDPRP